MRLVSVSLSAKLIGQIDKLIDVNQLYSGRSEIIRVAARGYLQRQIAQRTTPDPQPLLATSIEDDHNSYLVQVRDGMDAHGAPAYKTYKLVTKE